MIITKFSAEVEAFPKSVSKADKDAEGSEKVLTFKELGGQEASNPSIQTELAQKVFFYASHLAFLTQFSLPILLSQY